MHGGIYRCTGIYFFKSAKKFIKYTNSTRYKDKYSLCPYIDKPTLLVLFSSSDRSVFTAVPSHSCAGVLRLRQYSASCEFVKTARQLLHDMHESTGGHSLRYGSRFTAVFQYKQGFRRRRRGYVRSRNRMPQMRGIPPVPLSPRQSPISLPVSSR